MPENVKLVPEYKTEKFISLKVLDNTFNLFSFLSFNIGFFLIIFFVERDVFLEKINYSAILFSFFLYLFHRNIVFCDNLFYKLSFILISTKSEQKIKILIST